MFARIFKLGAQSTAHKILYKMCEELGYRPSAFSTSLIDFNKVKDIFAKIISEQISYSDYQQLPSENKLQIKKLLTQTLVTEIANKESSDRFQICKNPWGDEMRVSFPSLFYSEMALIELLFPTFSQIRKMMSVLNPKIISDESKIYDRLMLLRSKKILQDINKYGTIYNIEACAHHLKHVLITERRIQTLLKQPNFYEKIGESITSELIKISKDYPNISHTIYEGGYKNGQLETNEVMGIEQDTHYVYDKEDESYMLTISGGTRNASRLPPSLFEDIKELREKLEPFFIKLHHDYRLYIINYTQVLPQFKRQQPLPVDIINVISEHMGVIPKKSN